jgi:hypothetical protein
VARSSHAAEGIFARSARLGVAPAILDKQVIAAIRDESVEIERGWPTSTGEQPTADGLRFIGFVPRASQIGFAAKQARLAAKAIARELQTGTA